MHAVEVEVVEPLEATLVRRLAADVRGGVPFSSTLLLNVITWPFDFADAATERPLVR